MSTRVDLGVGIVVDNTVEKRSATIFAGVAFLLGVVVGYTLRGLRISYLKKKHEFLKRQVKKTEQELLK